MDGITDTKEPAGMFARLLEWRGAHVSERSFILFLAFLVGFFSAVAAFLLHWIIGHIVLLLTGSFDKANANWLSRVNVNNAVEPLKM